MTDLNLTPEDKKELDEIAKHREGVDRRDEVDKKEVKNADK